MRPFERDGARLVAEFEALEVELLASLVQQVCELLGDGPDATADDPLSRLAGEWDSARALDRGDPVVRRLFPDAYDDDRAASAEFHRFTAGEQRRARLDAAHLVLADLAPRSRDRVEVGVPADHVEAWLTTVNAVRLSLAVRLGIESDSDHDELGALPDRDPRAYVLDLYDWLGLVLESLLEAMYDTK